MITTRKRVAVALAVPTFALAGCYVVPVAPDGTPIYPYPPNTPVALVPAPAIVAAPYPYPAAAPSPPVVAAAKIPAVLTARLYPSNDMAAQTGMLSGTVTNMMTGKGRFQLEFRGEVLSGEATRVQGDEKRGVASAYGNRGTWMNCEYQMNTPYQGAGTCTLSTGERYSVHLGG
jgi:hypothetical protein